VLRKCHGNARLFWAEVRAKMKLEETHIGLETQLCAFKSLVPTAGAEFSLISVVSGLM
jgi:hypothetical protein